MAATREDIKGWLEEGKKQGWTHAIIACDTWDWEDYAVGVGPEDDFWKVHARLDGNNMQQVMEVYDLGLDIETQLNEPLAFHYPPRPQVTA